MTWGVPESISTEGAANFTSAELEDWLQRWGIHHRVSSYYYPRSNKRAEVSVKSAKRMIMNNLGPNGSLDSDKIARAALLHRNCPDPLTGLWPAQVIFGRVLRDHLPLQPGHFSVRAEWRQNAERRENALAHRHVIKHEALTKGSKNLPPLKVGDKVMIQDQSTHKPGRWTKTGTVVEVQEYDSYIVKIDGSNTVTKRNRKYLRKIATFIDSVAGPSPTVTTPTLRSSSSLPTPLAVSSPSASQPDPADNLFPEVSPEITVADIPRVKPSKKILKEKWIVAKPKPKNDSPTLTPPPPGTDHNYSALGAEAPTCSSSTASSASPSTLPAC